MNNELVSIILPVYNVESYLIKCIESVLKQTYTNIEILLIDDGSTDASKKICDEYKQRDNRIVFIHKENGGLSSARNVGLDIAKGRLICFIDSDDYIEPNMIESLKKNMEKYDSDISVCNFYHEKNGIVKIRVKKDYNEELCASNREKFMSMGNEYCSLMHYAWNKLYKKELFDAIRFPEGRIYEYMYILCDILEQAKKISFTLEPLYHYVYRMSSIGHTFNFKHFDRISSLNKNITFFAEKGYYDLAIKERNNKITAIIVNLAKMKCYRMKDVDIFNKYYQELVNTANELTWKESSKDTKLFKIFKKVYIEVIRWEYIVYYMIQNIRERK